MFGSTSALMSADNVQLCRDSGSPLSSLHRSPVLKGGGGGGGGAMFIRLIGYGNLMLLTSSWSVACWLEENEMGKEGGKKKKVEWKFLRGG